MIKYLCANVVWLSSVNMLRPHAFPQFSIYQKPCAFMEGILGVTESGTQIWEAGCFAYLFSDSTNVDWKYKLGSRKDLALTLGSTAYCLNVTKQVIYPQLSLGFLDSRRMRTLHYQMAADLKRDNIPKALSFLPGAGSTEGLHNHSHHLLSCDTGQHEKQYSPEKCLQTGRQG